MKYLTLETARFGNWLVKASLLEDTILIFFYNEYTMVSKIKFFYDEETFEYGEREAEADNYLLDVTGE